MRRRVARPDSTRLASARLLVGSPPPWLASSPPPRCMHAFYAACTALDAFLSRAAINRRNIEVEREPRERTPRDDTRATRSADFSFFFPFDPEEEEQRGTRTHAHVEGREDGPPPHR